MFRILLVDNYDSFTWNLVHLIGALGPEIDVRRNDALTADEALALDPDAIVLSPGPCTPNEAGICLELIEKAAPTIPMFGVCLGLQAMGQAFGGEVVRAPLPMHGKISRVYHKGEGIFRGINGPFEATRYHSLIVNRETWPRGPRRHRRERGRPHHGAGAPPPAAARCAVPSREHPVGAWRHHDPQLPRHRRALERDRTPRKKELTTEHRWTPSNLSSPKSPPVPR